MPRAHAESGYVTAEAAVVLPVLVVVALALAALLSGVVAQLRCVDAAQLGARALARGEPTAAVWSAVRAAAPAAARVSERRQGALVSVTVSAPLPWHGLFGLVDQRVSATSSARLEPGLPSDDGVGKSGGPS